MKKVEIHSERLSQYKGYLNKLDIGSLQDSLKIKKTPSLRELTNLKKPDVFLPVCSDKNYYEVQIK